MMIYNRHVKCQRILYTDKIMKFNSKQNKKTHGIIEPVEWILRVEGFLFTATVTVIKVFFG